MQIEQALTNQDWLFMSIHLDNLPLYTFQPEIQLFK